MDDVVEPAQPEQTAQQPTDEWARIFEGLRQRFPGASEGVLFCIHKLQQNPDVKLRDFKEEAALHGVSLSGRSHYSARVMLGLEPPPPPRGKKAAAEAEEGDGDGHEAPSSRARSTRPGRGAAGAGEDEEENPAIAALRRFQREQTEEVERLRQSIREALAVIDEALADD